MQKATHQRPSRMLRLSQWAARVTGMPDLWTAWQFDNAVLTFGRWVDNQLEERDESGRRVHTLRNLLDLPMTDSEKREMNRQSLQQLDQRVRLLHSGIRGT